MACDTVIVPAHGMTLALQRQCQVVSMQLLSSFRLLFVPLLLSVSGFAFCAHAQTEPSLSPIGGLPSDPIPDQPILSPAETAEHGIPLHDGYVTTLPHGDIRQAWLSQPTKRYGHGILGDSIEAAALTVRLANRQLVSFVLPEDSVFEDIKPRLGDLDGDGKTEVILVRSYLMKGASVAVLGLKNGRLGLLAQTPAIGTANRWLNPSILSDLDNSGLLTIGLVRTPHIGGQLQLWQYENGALKQLKQADGFSNHSIGSRALGLSAILNKGNMKRILIPDATQSRLILLESDTLTPLTSIALPARPVQDFVVNRLANGHQNISIALNDGTLYRLEDTTGRYFD
ncbi:FG-GAP repeat domain-containing protein [Cohaesibacter celericrescens]|uniref:VCBS repeat-containing protein n=1 Tax=Cohaesibacter celericrescens TaxID=2067669 RepID=A0A2N5XVH1_9HYPH|nr:VCBS repeat-containing protein [Cohaesibacter celericrescens]PLW78418.1 hypothetical protein C0081_04815 [Cohaesibacter celericrescens]